MICTDFHIVKSEGCWVVDLHDRSGELMGQHLKNKMSVWLLRSQTLSTGSPGKGVVERDKKYGCLRSFPTVQYSVWGGGNCSQSIFYMH